MPRTISNRDAQILERASAKESREKRRKRLFRSKLPTAAAANAISNRDAQILNRNDGGKEARKTRVF